MSLKKRLTSTFYATGAGFLGSTDAVDEAVAGGVVARMEANNLIFAWPDGRESFHHIQPGARGRTARWANKFNERGRA